MSRSRLPPSALDLKQFLLRKQVISFYRQVLRAINEEPSKEIRKQMKDWARYEFESKKNITEYDAIKMQLSKGQLTLKEVSTAIRMAK